MRVVLLVAVLGVGLSGCLSDKPSDEEAAPTATNNTAPRISGSPSSAITMNDTYNFQPSATDDDGDSLSFGINNRPSWASFDTSTGRLSGSPSLAHVGIYNQIEITVSDGTASDALSFSIEVVQSALGAVTLSWSAPDQNTDGTALTDLSGYKIYYGTTSRNYDNEITIDNPGLTTYMVEQLVPGTYYFAATAFNSDSVESSFSGEAVRVVN